MNRPITTAAALLATLLVLPLSPSRAAAQGASLRPVRRGDVTGVELGLEGSLVATRGEPLRWLTTAYEVRGLYDLRPAGAAEIRVLTSLRTDAAAAEVTADERGRAAIEVPVPDDAPPSFRAVIEIRAAIGVTRRFELNVQVQPRRVLSLVSARARIPERGHFRVFGRLSHRTTGRGLPREAVELRFRDGRGLPLEAPTTTRTDAAGTFAHTFRLPSEVHGPVSVEARVEETEDVTVTATANAAVGVPPAQALLVAVAPERPLVGSRAQVAVDVVVRTPEGQPVEGAALDIPLLEAARRQREPRERIRTDARGRARFQIQAPHVSTGFSDQRIQVSASQVGWGSGIGQAILRVSAVDHAVALAVEGGVLPEALGGRVYVRVTSADGQPRGAGVPVHLDGPRLPDAGLDATTDGDGVATFDLRLVPPRDTDRCGGDAATALDVRAGNGARAATRQACIPLDPDAAARVRVDPVIATAGDHIRVEVARAPSAARLPVAVTLLVVEGSRMRAISSHVIPGTEQVTEVTLPADAVGHVLVRARPLSGRSLEEVRGGSASLWVTAGARTSTAARLDPVEGVVPVTFGGDTTADRSVWAVALPLDEARALHGGALDRMAGPLADLRTPTADAGPALLAAALAARTPVDAGAPAVLRGRTLVPVPAPTDPVAQGLLRDPFRAQARFVGGRLALLLRAVEDHVEASVPQNIEHVAIEERGRWRFNDQILASLASSGRLGDAGATGLGGEPLTVGGLSALDRAFTYDNVARRITRKRLFHLLLALRDFARNNHLDLRWAWRGEPSSWLLSLRGAYVQGFGNIQPGNLVDGWGRPFELRQARGGRARFDRIAPVAGWELVSAGPDGRFGTGDDLWDPTARVVPSGSLYGEAVAEDALLARLAGVELGRATIAMGASLFNAPTVRVPQAADAGARQRAAELWRLPPELLTDPHALALRRPSRPGDGAGGTLETVGAGGGVVSLTLDAEPRTWGVVVESWTPEGVGSAALAVARGGAPVLVHGEIPRRLRTGEAIGFELSVTNVTDEGGSWVLATDGEGAVAIGAPDELVVPPGEARALPVTVEASRVGRFRVAVALRGSDGQNVYSLDRRVAVDRGLHPIRRRASAAVRDGSFEVDLAIPEGALSPSGRVVLLAPAGLADDPDLADVRREDPALTAWARTVGGRPLPPEARARLLRAQDESGLVRGEEVALSTACALIAYSAADPEDEESQTARALAAGALGGLPPMREEDGEAGRIRAEAAVLAALAVGGVAEIADLGERAVDPVSAYVAQLRPGLRGVLRRHPGEPSLLARAAAALLVADARDAHGLAMLERAARRTRRLDDGGLLVVPSEERAERGEALTATLALAVAAHQAGRAELARDLLAGASRYDSVVIRRGGEAVFWRLAAGAYGTLGIGAPEALVVQVDGDEHTVEMDPDRGVAIVPIEGLAPGESLTVEVEVSGDAGVQVRVEAVFGMPFTASEGGPLRLRLEGDVGREGGVAALELGVRATRRLSHPVVDLQLPAGVRADDALLEVIASASSVLSAERRNPGFVRIRLLPLGEDQAVVVPLPFRWGTHGDVRGFGAVGYASSRPEDMTVLRPRALSVTRRER